MDFGSLLNEVENAAGNSGTTNTAAMNNIDVAGLLNGFIGQHGLDISSANVNSLLNSPQFKQSMMNAVKSYATTKMSGAEQQNTTVGHVSQIADHLLSKIPGNAVSKQQLVNNLLAHIADNVKL